MKKQLLFLKMMLLGVLVIQLLFSCGDDDTENSNQDRQAINCTVYFGFQNLQKTLLLGNGISYDNSLDNAHKFRLFSTSGGVSNNIEAVDIVVDESLCDNVWFTDEDGYPSYAVTAMPKEYYVLESNKIYYDGSRGYVDVQLTDAFFNDPKSVEKTYVIPILMTGVTGSAKIFTGKLRDGYNSPRTDVNAWIEPAKDYTLCCVKYVNPWHANYLRRSTNEITIDGETMIDVRKDMTLVDKHPGFYDGNPVNTHDDECLISTKSMKQAIYHAYFHIPPYKDNFIFCDLILTFNGNSCSITSADDNITVQGSGEFIPNGTEMSEYKDYQWVSGINEVHEKCDILCMSYKVDFIEKNIQVSTNDTLVVEGRSVKENQFRSIYYKR